MSESEGAVKETPQKQIWVTSSASSHLRPISASDGAMYERAGSLLSGFTLLLICVLAFSIRLFSVFKYESVIHEFDPYFNYRVTQFLTKEGFYNLWNWFDDRTWYPLGRVIGGTMFPVSTNARIPLYCCIPGTDIHSRCHVQAVTLFQYSSECPGGGIRNSVADWDV